MNNLLVGGAAIQLKRDLGTPNVVQGFVTTGITRGATLASPLPTNYVFNAIEGSVQFILDVISGTVVWIKISGVWKQATPWIKVSGLWKQATAFIKESGTWK